MVSINITTGIFFKNRERGIEAAGRFVVPVVGKLICRAFNDKGMCLRFLPMRNYNDRAVCGDPGLGNTYGKGKYQERKQEYNTNSHH